jgi:hypothetical protein
MTFAAEAAAQILSQDARGRVLVSRERRESLFGGVRPQWDERSKVCAVRRDQILNAILLTPKSASSSKAEKVVAKSRRGHRTGQEQWRVD